MNNNILLFQKLVPSYRVPVFRELYEKYGIITCHSKERKGGNWKSSVEMMDYPNELIPVWYYRKTETSAIQNIFRVILKYKPGIIISEYSLSYLTFWMLWLLRPLFRYRLILWTHGVRNDEIFEPFKRVSRKIFLKVLGTADAVVFYSEKRKQIVADNLHNSENLFVARNTLDTNKLQSIYNKLSIEGKSSVKKELGLKNKYNLIFTGRLLKEKRIDLVLDSFLLVAENYDAGFHFIGDGPELGIIKKYAEQNNSIYVHGAIFDENIVGRYLYSSDLYLMPGYVGLGIVHAFAFGLPVISCKGTINGPFHSPEAEYLKDGINGFWCDSSPVSISYMIKKCLDDNELLSFLAANAYKTAYDICSINRMIKGFEDAIKFCTCQE